MYITTDRHQVRPAGLYGLAVRLFLEDFDPRRHGQPGAQALGATHTLTRRLGDWWLTAVGEVPQQTLLAFAQALERRK